MPACERSLPQLFLCAPRLLVGLYNVLITKHLHEVHSSRSQLWAGGIHSAKKLDVLCGSCQCAYLFVGHSCFGVILKDLTVLLRGMGGELEMIISGNLGDTSLLYQAELP